MSEMNDNKLAQMEAKCKKHWAELLDEFEKDVPGNTIRLALFYEFLKRSALTPMIARMLFISAGLKLSTDAAKRLHERGDQRVRRS